MNALNHIKTKYQLSYGVPMPVILKGIGRHSGIKDVFLELGFRSGAEIGTRDGNYAEELCQDLPDLQLYCIDPWKIYKDYQEVWIKDQKSMDALFKDIKRKLSKYNCKIIRKTSMEAVKSFKSNSLDFVFIDGNHNYNYVLDDISKWSRVVRAGGIIFGHDYSQDYSGVIRAVQEYIKNNNIKPWFLLKVGGQADCWMFVKQDI